MFGWFSWGWGFLALPRRRTKIPAERGRMTAGGNGKPTASPPRPATNRGAGRAKRSTADPQERAQCALRAERSEARQGVCGGAHLRLPAKRISLFMALTM